MNKKESPQKKLKGILEKLKFISDPDVFLEEVVKYCDLLRQDFTSVYKKVIEARNPKKINQVKQVRERVRVSYTQKLILRPGTSFYDDVAAEYLKLPRIDILIHEAKERFALFKEISEQLQTQSKIRDYVITPPDSRENPLPKTLEREDEEGFPGFHTESIQPRVETLIYLLRLQGLNENDIESYSGRIEPSMFRKVSYFSVYVKSLKKLVYVCNEIRNITFVFHDIEPSQVEKIDHMTKQQKTLFISSQEGIGKAISYSDKWEEEILNEIFGDKREKKIIRLGKKKEKSLEALQQLRKMIQALLEAEEVVRVEWEEVGEGEKRKRRKILRWLKPINPQKRYGISSSKLSVLLAKFTGESKESYGSFQSIVSAIREVYLEPREPYYEIYENKDIEFEVADMEKRAAMLRTLLEAGRFVEIEEKLDKDTPERTLYWLNRMNPQEKYGGFSSKLNILFGKWRGIDGGRSYKSFTSIIPVIRDLYQGRYDKEDMSLIQQGKHK